MNDALKRLEEWPVWTSSDVAQNVNAGLDYARSLWHDGYGSVREDLPDCECALVYALVGERFLRFATGGWSDNESVIGALDRNVALSSLTWRLSARGGLHIYAYMPGAHPRAEHTPVTNQ